MNVATTELTQDILQALSKLGYDAAEASSISDVLLYAQTRGSSRGVAELLSTGTVQKIEPTRLERQKETPASAYINAHGAHAMLAMSEAADIAGSKAKQSGIAVVTVHNMTAASGALGYYPYKIAEHGLVGIVMATTPPMVAAAGTYEALLGANPIAIAVPTKADPLVLDMDTAALAFPGVRALAARGQQLPGGIAYDKDGNATTDPVAALDGAIRPFDKGYKGSHLALMVQILAGGLAGGRTADDLRGHTIIAIDPEVLCGLESFDSYIESVIASVKRAEIAPGFSEVLLPGEREQRLYRETVATGNVDIDDAVYRELQNFIASEK